MSTMLTKNHKTQEVSRKTKVKVKKKKSSKKVKHISHWATVYTLIDQCCKQQVTSPRMLTQYFLHKIIEEMTSIALEEKSQPKIGVINQISFDLSDFVAALDISPKSTKIIQSDKECSRKANLPLNCPTTDLNRALNELKMIDNSIHNLLKEKEKIYNRLQLLNVSNQESSRFISQNERVVGSNKKKNDESRKHLPQPEVIKCRSEKDSSNGCQLEDEVELSDSEVDSTLGTNLLSPTEPISDVLPHFDGNVLNTAALCAKQKLSLPLKEEVDIHIENIDNITFKKFADVGATQMKLNGHTLICAASNGQIIRFCFNGSIIPYLPHRTKSFDLCSSSVVDMIVWMNKFLIIATCDGTITKCSLHCKISKVFSFEHEITTTAELGGLLYATSKTGFLHVINLRSMTLQRDPVELGHIVSMMKSSVFNSSTLLVFLTDKCEIIGTSIVHGFIDSVIFKFALPDMTVFDLVQTDALPDLLTFFCGTPTSTSCLQLADNNLSQGSIIHHGTSAMIVHYNLLFLGSLNGDITIVNLKSNNTYCYQRIVNGKIISFACHMSSLYIGTESCIYCMLIDNNDDIKIK